MEEDDNSELIEFEKKINEKIDKALENAKPNKKVSGIQLSTLKETIGNLDRVYLKYLNYISIFDESTLGLIDEEKKYLNKKIEDSTFRNSENVIKNKLTNIPRDFPIYIGIFDLPTVNKDSKGKNLEAIFDEYKKKWNTFTIKPILYVFEKAKKEEKNIINIEYYITGLIIITNEITNYDPDTFTKHKNLLSLSNNLGDIVDGLISNSDKQTRYGYKAKSGDEGTMFDNKIEFKKDILKRIGRARMVENILIGVPVAAYLTGWSFVLLFLSLCVIIIVIYVVLFIFIVIIVTIHIATFLLNLYLYRNKYKGVRYYLISSLGPFSWLFF